MAKHRRINLGGKRLHELSVIQIVEFASRRGHQRYALGPEDAYWRNRHVLRAFMNARGEDSNSDQASTTELVEAFHQNVGAEYSIEFDALRIGEHLGWAMEHGIVDVGRGGWQILCKELQFELVGPANRQHAIRVRNAPPEIAEENARLWGREQKRRERARLKRLSQHKSSIGKWLDKIVAHYPDSPLEGPLARFGFGDFQTIGVVAQTIVDSVDAMTLDEAREIDNLLGNIIVAPLLGGEMREPSKPPRVAPVDDAILGDLRL